MSSSNNRIYNLLLLLIVIIITIIINENHRVNSVQILVWSGGSWSGYGMQDFPIPNYLGQHVVKPKCSVECSYIYDRVFTPDSDAILFEAQPFASWTYTFLKQPPELPQKEVDQLYINFGYEHEKYFPIGGHPGYQRQIDINSTFRETDQVQVTFTCSWGSGENGSINNFLKKPVDFDKKKGLLGFMSSNCHSGGAIYRTCYIKEMMKHMQVDALGECMNNKKLDSEDFPHSVFADLGDSLKIKEKVLSKYKFSLAFENNNITDYVTEKVYTSLLSGSIPIYMGAPNIDEWVPKKSIIKTDDFKSPKHLVDYLLYLAGNETAYNEYFEWKNQDFPDYFIKKYENCLFYKSDCRLCEYIEETKKKNKLPNNGFRISFGETLEDFRQTRILNIESDSCLVIKQDTKFVETIKDKMTVMFWIQPKTTNDDKVIISMDINKLVISITCIWKRYYVKVCISDTCIIGETPIFVGEDWKHIAVTIGPSTINDLDHLDSNGDSGEPSTVKIFVDGLLDTSTTTFLDLTHFTTSSINVGCTTITTKLDDLSIWRTNLDELEIAHAMFKKYRGDEPNHLLYMTFNSETIKDYSINNKYTTITHSNMVTEASSLKKLILKVESVN